MLHEWIISQTNGQAERTNQTVKQILRTTTLGFMNWSLVLDNAEMAINSAPLRDCGVSPFFLNLGCHPCVWPDVEHAVEHDLCLRVVSSSVGIILGHPLPAVFWPMHLLA